MQSFHLFTSWRIFLAVWSPVSEYSLMQPLSWRLFFFRLSKWICSFSRSPFSLSLVLQIYWLWCSYILDSHSTFSFSLPKLLLSNSFVTTLFSSSEVSNLALDSYFYLAIMFFLKDLAKVSRVKAVFAKLSLSSLILEIWLSFFSISKSKSIL